MSEDPRIATFLEESQAAGIPHASLVGMLTAHGWREKDIYRALGDHYRKARIQQVLKRLMDQSEMQQSGIDQAFLAQ